MLSFPLYRSHVALLLLLCCLLIPAWGCRLSSGGASATVEQEQLLLTTTEKRRYRISLTRKGLLHVVVEKPGAVFKPFPLALNLARGKTVPRKTAGGYVVGPYLVKAETKGFAIYRDKQFLFRIANQAKMVGQVEQFSCGKGETLHGLGHASRSVFLSFKEYTVYNESKYGNQAYLYIPFIFSSGGDALYFNVHGRDSFKFSTWQAGSIEYVTRQDSYDFYYYHEPDPKQLVSRFYALGGKSALLPRWAYGYLQSKYGYRNQQEVYELIKQFEQYRIPLSAVILDLYWFRHMGDLDWDRSAFPDPAALDRFLEERSIKLITISEPFFTRNSRNFSPFYNQGMFATDKQGNVLTMRRWWTLGKSPDGAVINPFSEKTKVVLGAQYVAMLKTGIDGFWTDLGEPEGVPAHAMFSGMTELEAHNYFNRAWSQLVFQAVRKAFPRRRVLNLTRSGFTGSWRYGVSTWSGDVQSGFGALDFHPALGINAGLCGLSFWGSDVGGFESGKRKPGEELFIRWMQFGAFTPVFRAHGSQSPREPWIHGKKATDIIRRYIRLRYRLLPYIYSTAFQTWQAGVPMMRALFLEHAADPKCREISDQYYFGDWLLVAPVTEPQATAPQRTLYLPAGEWYDFHTWQRVTAGTNQVPARIEDIPIYLKGGGLLPMRDGKRFVLLALPAATGSRWTWYDDDGSSYAYEQGKYTAVKMSLSRKRLVLEDVPPSLKTLVLRIPTACGVQPDGAVRKQSGRRSWYETTLTLQAGKNEIVFVK